MFEAALTAAGDGTCIAERIAGLVSPDARLWPAQPSAAETARRSPTRPSNATRRSSARSSTTGADVNAAQIDGMTALHWAVYHDDAETAAIAGASGRQRQRRESLRRASAVPGLHERQRGLVKLLLDAGADANATMQGGETVLMTAARVGKSRGRESAAGARRQTTTRVSGASRRP